MLMQRINAALASLALALFACTAFAQAYPTKPIRVIVPFPAGGLTDVLVRGIGQELTKVWGQPIVVENRPGANTIIGAEAAARSAPDGYTLFMATDSTLSMNAFLYNKLSYDPVKDFAPVVNLAAASTVLVSGPSFPANNLKELVALAKSKPGTITYGTFGPGSATHIDTEAFSQITGIKLVHVPYKGISEVIPAIMAGQIDVALSGLPPALGHLRAGKLKAIVHAGEQRAPMLPNTPTFGESGAPGFVSRSWFGLVAPAATPRPVIDRIAAEVSRIVKTKQFDDKFVTGVGLEPFVMMPDQFAEFLKTNRATYGARIKELGFKLD